MINTLNGIEVTSEIINDKLFLMTEKKRVVCIVPTRYRSLGYGSHDLFMMVSCNIDNKNAWMPLEFLMM